MLWLLQGEVMMRELQYTWSKIELHPKNDASWAYALAWVDTLPRGCCAVAQVSTTCARC